MSSADSLNGLGLRPQKAMQASWIATGYFDDAHFEGAIKMSHEEACRMLDETGMLQAFDMPSDQVGQDMNSSRQGFQNACHWMQLVVQQMHL